MPSCEVTERVIITGDGNQNDLSSTLPNKIADLRRDSAELEEWVGGWSIS